MVTTIVCMLKSMRKGKEADMIVFHNSESERYAVVIDKLLTLVKSVQRTCLKILLSLMQLNVCLCVHVYERERERSVEIPLTHTQSTRARACVCVCLCMCVYVCVCVCVCVCTV